MSFSDGYYSDKKNLSYIFNDTGVHHISLLMLLQLKDVRVVKL